MPPEPPPFSPVILLTLLLVVAASSVTFWLLVRRATSHRQWVAFADWARDRRFRFARFGPEVVPPPFDALKNVAPPLVRVSLSDKTTTLAQVEVPAPAATVTATVTAAAAASAPGVTSAAAAAAVGGQQPRILWHVLVRDIAGDWPPTGLRPAGAAASVLDLFSLSSFPTLGATERFIAYGTDSAAARVVSKSMLRSLLPPDVGLLLHGRRLVLDFSDRPFDTIEFGRMLALADQIAKHVPATGR